MKYFLLLAAAFPLLSVAAHAGQDRVLIGDLCSKVQNHLKNVDIEICTNTGKIVGGGYSSEEVVYRLEARLYRNSRKAHQCILSGGEGGLAFEGCR